MPNNFPKTITDTMPTKEPTIAPVITGIKNFLNRSHFLYSGIARATVAGPNKKSIIPAP